MQAGVTAVSQTAGPETVLAGEAKVPYALLGYATDYANGVKPEAPTPVEELIRLVEASTATFARTLAAAVPRVTARARAGGDAFLLGLRSRGGRGRGDRRLARRAATIPGSTSCSAPMARRRCARSSPPARGAGRRTSRPDGPTRRRRSAPPRPRWPGTRGRSCWPRPTSRRSTRASRAPRSTTWRPAATSSLGAAHDARPYIVGLPRLDPELLALRRALARRRGPGRLRRARRDARHAAPRAPAGQRGRRPGARDRPVRPAELAALVRGRLREPPIARLPAARARFSLALPTRRAGSLDGMEYEREQEELAAEEAAHIGGGRDDDLDYIEARLPAGGHQRGGLAPGRGGRRRRGRGLRGGRGRADRASREPARPVPDRRRRATTTRRPRRSTRSTARPTRSTPPRTTRTTATAELATTLSGHRWGVV